MLDAPDLVDIQDSFAEALPRIEGLASAHLGFRRSDCKEDEIQEVVALAWQSYRSLALQGRDIDKLLGRIVEFAPRKVRSGGRLVGFHPIRDVMSPTSRFRHGHRVDSLPIGREETAQEIVDALVDDASPADQAVVNVDVEAWLDTLDDRQRTIACNLASGLNTVEVARIHGISRARIHQLRLVLMKEWRRFHTGDR